MRSRRTFVVGLGELVPFNRPVASLVPRFGIETLRNSASERVSVCVRAGVHEWAGTVRSKKKGLLRKTYQQRHHWPVGVCMLGANLESRTKVLTSLEKSVCRVFLLDEMG